MSDVHERRRGWIRQFGRLHTWAYDRSGGRLGAKLGGHPMLLLHSVGFKSGQPRTTPLLYMADGEDVVIVASFYGSPGHPAWYRNLRAKPDCEVRVGRERYAATARTASPEERARLWPMLVDHYAGFTDYQARTEREIPVVVLSRAGS